MKGIKEQKDVFRKARAREDGSAVKGMPLSCRFLGSQHLNDGMLPSVALVPGDLMLFPDLRGHHEHTRVHIDPSKTPIHVNKRQAPFKKSLKLFNFYYVFYHNKKLTET